MNTLKKMAAVLGLGGLMVGGIATLGATPANADGLQFAIGSGGFSVVYTQANCAPAPYYVAPPVVERFGDRDHRGFDQGRNKGNWGHDRGGDRR